ncbi:MAG: molybdopterin cofactor-binding domain-containing protein [Clostridia bacterium]|nr:molybdopterin cofactor-binding domain-containing protein [Clostridia bacterium]
MHDFKWVGKPVTRVDARDKVTGAQKYMGDLKFPGMLYGRVLRSKYAHALIKAIDASRAEAAPGVVRVLTWRDVPGLNAYGIAVPDQPVLCHEKVRYTGDAVALIIAETPEDAESALPLVSVDYEPLPVVDDPEAAMDPDAPKVHASGNIHLHTFVANGDVEEGFRDADVIVEAVYHTPRQMHAFMEPEQGVGAPNPDGTITVYCGAQHPYRDQMQISRSLAIKPSLIRVVANPTGGAFGGKDEITLQILLALGALKTGRPVKIVLSREESVLAGWKRHPMKVYMKTGAKSDGALVAHKVRIVSDKGAYASLGGPVTNLALEHSVGVYRIPNVSLDATAVYTNNGICGAFRGFGAPQVVFAMETQLDAIAEKTGIGRMEIRMKNALRGGERSPLGYTMVKAVGTTHTLEAADKCDIWVKRKELKTQASAPWRKRGIGIATEMQGTGLGVGLPDYGAALIRLTPDGRYVVSLSCPEIGQGNSTTYAQMAAECLECNVDDVSVITGDTALSPDSGSCTASRSVYTGGNAIFRASAQMRDKLIMEAARILGAEPANVALEDGRCSRQDGDGCVSVAQIADAVSAEDRVISADGAFIWPEADKSIPGAVGLPHIINSYVTHVALVEVDEMTGETEVLKVFAAIDAGRVVNPQGLAGQSEGGVVMGMGFAIMEDTIIKDGIVKTPNLSTYIVPTSMDAPEIETVAVEVLEPTGPFGAKGIGEAVMVPVIPAITLAIRDAVGARMEVTPATAERVYVKVRETYRNRG